MKTNFLKILDRLGIEFLDEEYCRLWILHQIHEKPCCPFCSEVFEDPAEISRFWKNVKLTCPTCKKQSKSSTGTVLQGIHGDFRALVLFFIGMELGFGVEKVAKMIGRRRETVRAWRRRFFETEQVQDLAEASLSSPTSPGSTRASVEITEPGPGVDAGGMIPEENCPETDNGVEVRTIPFNPGLKGGPQKALWVGLLPVGVVERAEFVPVPFRPGKVTSQIGYQFPRERGAAIRMGHSPGRIWNR